jgi:hypothetical protein
MSPNRSAIELEHALMQLVAASKRVIRMRIASNALAAL